ncbi:DoxX family protein [Nocardioides sp. GXZ039]|uniref:DoxX family protein n=1 Tax=Nocardioides sp. GXZ039 TaxID=3136018 RepID=UPI0030F49D44
MRIAYLALTILAALMNGYAAFLSLTGAASVGAIADRLEISRRWMRPFGLVLTCGALGLLAGLAVPALGIAAAAGLVGYFVCAVAAHLRVHDTGLGGAVFFLVLAAAALLSDVAYRQGW